MSIDLERFPWSDSAKRMLTYVTKDWYEKSYVGKWIYEVMGREVDLAAAHIEELPYQMFIDTATWGLKYHEIKYGLPVREDLSYEERRRLLREKKDTKAPMTPWRMEQILKGVTDYNVGVHDINEAGYYFSHPNIFSVQLEGESEINIGDVKRKIDKLKQSHTMYILSVILMIVEGTEAFNPRVKYHSDFSWWEQSLDGRYLLDGHTYLNHWFLTEFRPVYPFNAVIAEEYAVDHIYHELPEIQNKNEFKPSLYIRGDFVWWEGFLDGKNLMDGIARLNGLYPMRFGIYHRLFLDHQEAFIPRECISLPDSINTEEAEIRGIQRVIMNWRDGNRIMNGDYLLNGETMLNAGEPPYLQTVRILAPVKQEEDFSITMFVPSLAAELNGKRSMDGTVKLNSGREVL